MTDPQEPQEGWNTSDADDTTQAVIEAARALMNPDMHPTSRAMVKAMQNLRAAMEAHDAKSAKLSHSTD